MDLYSLAGTPGRGVEIQMDSTEVDAYLILRSPTGKQEDDDDSGPGWSNARIRARLDEEGAYDLVATSFEPGETGAYRLSVLPREIRDNTPGGGIALNETVEGFLGPGDPRTSDGEFCDEYELEVTEGQRVRIEMRSTAFTPYLIYVDPCGMQEDEYGSRDYSGLLDALFDAPTRAREEEEIEGEATLEVNTTAGGVARIGATNTWGEREGTYTLRVTALGGGESIRRVSLPRFAGGGDWLTRGQRVRGHLAPGDLNLPDGTWGDVFTFMGQAGEEVTVTMTSERVSPAVVVQAPGGQQFPGEAMGSGGECRVRMRLPLGGEYHIICTSGEPSETGSYMISVE
jgi:hypothetical protein